MSFCRCCRYYKPEGQRGGSCQILDAPVKGGWNACRFAASPFDCSDVPPIREPHRCCEIEHSVTRWQVSTVEFPRYRQPMLARC